MSTYKWTYKKYMGDDRYSWAVFRDGRPMLTGLDRSEAKRVKEKYEAQDSSRGNESSSSI